MTWRQVAREAKVSASSLTRMAKGSRPDIDTVASLAAWASLDAATFFPRSTEESPLSMVAAYIHRDPSLTPAAAAALEQVVRATHSQLTGGDDPRPRRQR
jgi:transcriptional regulator with XRE-family HTH domain